MKYEIFFYLLQDELTSTLLGMQPECFESSRPISWLLIHSFFVLPDQQHPWYWLFRVNDGYLGDLCHPSF